MSDHNIADLIRRLRDLRTEEDRLISLVESAILHPDNNNVVQVFPTTPPAAGNDTLPVVIPIEGAYEAAVNYREGDRVIIINLPSRRSFGIGPSRTAAERDRRAVVTHVSGDRVYLRTDNNQTTWRLAKNIRRAA